MVSVTDKLAKIDLLWEKNIVSWLISQADMFSFFPIQHLNYSRFALLVFNTPSIPNYKTFQEYWELKHLKFDQIYMIR
jgi:hypothetical protein